MSVGRNDPCPCGSGKKYKKCCLKKENVIQLAEHQVEQFYRQKQGLVEMMNEFLVEHVTFEEYHQLEAEFHQRTKHTLNEEMEEGFFKYWLFFYHRFDNQLRFIEWFYQVEGERLPQRVQAMLDGWLQLKPRLLQAVDQTEEAIIFEDLLTEEKFPLANHQENISNVIPWVSTIAMIEQFNDLYYFNGVRVTVGPEALKNASVTLKELKEETGMQTAHILMDYFPELLASLSEDMAQVHDTAPKNEIVKTTLTYKIADAFLIHDFLRSQADLRIEHWSEDHKELVWAGNWRAYTDSELDEPIKLADVYGSIKVSGSTMTIESLESESIQQMKQRLTPLNGAIRLSDEKVKRLGSYSVKPQNRMVNMDEDTPKCFAFYAEQNLSEAVEEPIPKYDDLSIRQLIAEGNIGDAETWLRQSEYNAFRLAMEQEGTVEVTADYNTVRKELGMPLSPFVTGGERRVTSFQPIQVAPEIVLLEEDIPYLEELGFTPGNVGHFYVIDLIRFYRMKTAGKSDATKRKYRNSLYDFREMMMEKASEHWHEQDLTFWKSFLTADYHQLHEEHGFSKTEHKDFLSVIRTFLMWIDQTRFHQIIDLVKQLEQ